MIRFPHGHHRHGSIANYCRENAFRDTSTCTSTRGNNSISKTFERCASHCQELPIKIGMREINASTPSVVRSSAIIMARSLLTSHVCSLHEKVPVSDIHKFENRMSHCAGNTGPWSSVRDSENATASQVCSFSIQMSKWNVL